MKRTKFLFLVPFLFLLASCEKEEDLWTLPPKGAEKVESMDLGPNYENVIFFKLATAVKVNRDLLKWDIAFASGADERHIILNGGKSVQVYNTHDSAFAKSTYSTNPANWEWDNPNGDKDSTAIGAWYDTTLSVSKNMVYILDLGAGNPQFKKIKFLSVTATAYSIRVANLDNSGQYDAIILKKGACAYTYFSITDRLSPDYEPPSSDWDIVFTRYRHIYYDMNPVTPYMVNGVLINRGGVSIYESNSLAFESITASMASGLMLNHKADEIGFDWKFYDMSAGKYNVDAHKVFILQDKDGFYYKLKFIDFYNDQGAKGHPKFIYQRL